MASQDFTHQRRLPPSGTRPAVKKQGSLWINSTCGHVPTSEENEFLRTGCPIIKHYRGNEFHDLFPTLSHTNQIVNYILFHLQRSWGKKVVSGKQHTGEKHQREACYKYASAL